jgi:hypothetical protein
MDRHAAGEPGSRNGKKQTDFGLIPGSGSQVNGKID